MNAQDNASIINAVNLYAVALDARRYSLFEQIFTADIVCDFGGGAAFTGRAPLISAFGAIHAGFAATQHMIMGHTIAPAGGEAGCFSYVHARFRRLIGDEDCLFESTGWYDDQLVRAADGWRIKNRISRMVSYNGDIRVMQAMPGVDTNYPLYGLYQEADAGAIAFAPLATKPR